MVVALERVRDWHQLFCLEGLEESATIWVCSSVTSHGICFQPRRMGYSLALEKVCKIQGALEGTHFLPSLAQEHILGQYSWCEMVPWGVEVVIPFLPLPDLRTIANLAHICPQLKAGVTSASAVRCPCKSSQGTEQME